MKRILTILAFIICCITANSQTYTPSQHAGPQNKPSGISSATPLDSRSVFYDATNFVYRPYVSTSEVLSYLNLAKYRTGQFDIVVNSGGSLSGGGVLTGGVNTIYYFKNGTADSNLVIKIYGASSTDSSIYATNYRIDTAKANLRTAIAGKISTTLPSGQILVGNISNVATAVTPGNDVSVTSGGSFTVLNQLKTASNGLTASTGNVKIGGTLTDANTTLLGNTGTENLLFTNIHNFDTRYVLRTKIFSDAGQATATFAPTFINLTGGDSVGVESPTALFSVKALASKFYHNVTIFDTTTITTMGLLDSSDRAASTAWVKRQGYGSGGSGSGLTNLNGLTASTQAFATGTSGSDFNIVSATATHTFNLPNSSGSNRGLLISADWTTFNNKQPAGNYITALMGDATASGPGSAALTLTTVVIPGSCTNCSVTYDAKGRATSFTSGSAGSAPVLAPQKIGYGNASGLLSGTGSSAFTVDTANRKAFLDSVNTKNYQTNTIAKHADSSVYFGTSITAGTGAFNNNYRFATVTARSFNTLEANYGQGGASLQVDMLAKIPLIAPYNYLLHRFIVMEWLTNDIINGSNIGTWDTAHAGPIYRRIIDTCLARGWPASKIVIVSPGYIDSTAFTNATGARQFQYWSLSQDVATSRGVKFVDVKNPEAALGNSILMQDQNLHPNNDGHALYAQLIRQILTDSVRIEGQAMGVTGVAEFNRLKVRIVDTATAFGIPLSIEPDGTLARSWRDDYIRNSYRLTQPQGAALSLTGKGFFGNVTSPNAVDVIQANGAINGQILKATGTTPSGTTGAFAGMYFVPGSYGGLFAYDYTGGSALDFTVNPFGTRLAVGSATFSGPAILQVAGTSTGTDPADGDSSHTYISSGWFKRNASGPSGSFIPLSFSGVVNVTQNSHFLNFDYGVNSSFLRATGSDVSTTGAGVGMAYSGGVGFIYAYDRDASTGKDMSIGAFSDRTIFGSSSFYNAAKTQFAGAAYFNDNISIGVYPGTQALDVGQAARIRGILYTNDTAALDKRFSYNTNIHSSFTQYSLIDKAYADSAYGSSASDTLKLVFAGTGERTFWGSNDTLHGKTIKGLNSVSIASGTDSTINVQLVNDSATGAAANYGYSTNASGRKGWYALPAGLSGLTSSRIPFSSGSTTLIDDGSLRWVNASKTLIVGSISGSFSQNIYIVGNGATQSLANTAGTRNVITGGTYTDNATSASGTVGYWGSEYINGATLAASNSSVTYTNAATLYVTAPTAGTNITITNPLALKASTGNISIDAGNLQTNSIRSNGSAPGIAAGTGAGTSPSISVTGSDMAGTISVTTGTLPTLSATVATVTYNIAYGIKPHVILTPANSNAALLSGVNMVFVNDGTSTNSAFVLTAGTTALTAATTYIFYYLAIQ